MTTRVSSASSSLDPSVATLNVGSVSYLNAKPLIHGLDSFDDVSLSLDVPSKLIDGLRDGRFDVALLPIIDYPRLANLRIVSAGGIGCDGPTLTVRIFGQQRMEQTRVLACDPDSHTSVALARIILAEQYGLHPEFVDLRNATGATGEARLLIGDKVVCEEPAGFEHQLDLGAAWKALTGLPFVFAVWVARDGVDLRDLATRLEQCKRDGLRDVREIITRYALPRGWPAGLALQYLTMYLQYDIGGRQLEAINVFFEKAAKHGLIDAPPKPITLA